MHLISDDQLTRDFLEEIFDIVVTDSRIRNPGILATFFAENSTRTRCSFESAMYRHGGKVISLLETNSSVKKGESLEDTIRMLSGNSDIIVIRHPSVGAAERAAKVSSVPVINAGDGKGSHPTQAILDLYTIKKELGKIDGLKILVAGDIGHGRAAKSFINAIRNYDVDLTFTTPWHHLRAARHSYLPKGIHKGENIASNLTEDISDKDVVYMTRPQQERWNPLQHWPLDEYYKSFSLTRENVAMLKENAIVLHPLPRTQEIPTWFDEDPRAAYFKQAANGVFVRKAILYKLLCMVR